MRELRDHAPERALVTAAALGAAILFAPFAWLLATRRVLTQFDLSWFNLPFRFLYHRALHDGDSIIWTPFVFSGFFIQGDGQPGLTHPLHLLLYRALPLTAAFDLESAFNYAFGYAGMFVLQRRLGLTRAASMVGATLFAFSGFNLLHFSHMHAVAVVAHMPWMLAAVDVMVSDAGLRRAIAATAMYGLLTGSQILAGYPQYVWITLQASVAFAIIRVKRPRRFVLLAVAIVLGAVVGAAQLLPHFDALRDSSRAGMGRDFALGYSLHPLNLLQLWSPYAFAGRAYLMPGEVEALEFGLYNSAFCSAALLWLYLRRGELGAMRRLAAGLTIAAAVFTVLAFGRFGGVGRLVAQLPVVEVFRAPAREVSAVHLYLALLGGIAFDDIVRVARAGRPLDWQTMRPLALLLLLPQVTLGLRLLPLSAIHAVAPHLEWATSMSALGGVAIVAATVAAIVMSARGFRWALPTLALLIAADLGVWGWSYVWNPPPQRITAVAANVWAPPTGRPGMTIYEAYGVPAADMPVLLGYRMFNGYVGMWPLRTLPLDSLAAQRLGGTNWRHDTTGWHAVRDPMPRARLVGDVRVSAEIARDVDAIDIAATALVSRAMGPFGGGVGAAGVLVDRPGKIIVHAEAPSRQLLVLTERFHRGWRATSDGSPVEAVAAYGDQLAVAVDAGSHRIELTFAPASVRLGAALSLGSGIAIGLLFLGTRYSRGEGDR